MHTAPCSKPKADACRVHPSVCMHGRTPPRGGERCARTAHIHCRPMRTQMGLTCDRGRPPKGALSLRYLGCMMVHPGDGSSGWATPLPLGVSGAPTKGGAGEVLNHPRIT